MYFDKFGLEEFY